MWMGLLVTSLGGGCTPSAPPSSVPSQPTDLIAALALASHAPDTITIDLGTPGSRHRLGKGWAGNGQGPDRDFVWGLGQASILRVPLSSPGNVELAIEARPYDGADRDDQSVTVLVNDQYLGEFELTGGWSSHRLVAPRGLFHSGENIIEFQYAWSAVPAELSNSSDRRALAVAFDRITVDPDSRSPNHTDDRPRAVVVDLGAAAHREHLREGWGGPEHSPEGTTYAWAIRTHATIDLTLGHPVPSTLELRARPFVHPSLSVQSVDLAMNGSPIGTWLLEPGWNDYRAELPASVFQTGTNQLSLQFARAVSPASLGTGVDQRALAAAIDHVAITPKATRAIVSDDQLVLPLGVRTSFPLTLPPSSFLEVELADADSSLVVELSEGQGSGTRSWQVEDSRQLHLTGPEAPTRVVQVSLAGRRGERADPVVVQRLIVRAGGEAQPHVTGLRPHTQADEADLPASP